MFDHGLIEPDAASHGAILNRRAPLVPASNEAPSLNVSRFAGTTADTTEIERSWRNRYIPAQQLYAATAHPTDRADIIVHNAQLQRPAGEARGPH